MSNKMLILIGLIIIIAIMVMSAQTVLNNRMYIEGNPQIAANAAADQKIREEFTNKILSGQELVMDENGNVVFEEPTKEESNIVLSNPDSTVDDENNTIRIDRPDFYTIYTHDGEKVIDARAYMTFETNEIAKQELDEVKQENLSEDVREIFVDNNQIVIVFNERVYSSLTLEELRLTAQFYGGLTDLYKDQYNQ